jgi:hypothetical protein
LNQNKTHHCWKILRQTKAVKAGRGNSHISHFDDDASFSKVQLAHAHFIEATAAATPDDDLDAAAAADAAALGDIVGS